MLLQIKVPRMASLGTSQVASRITRLSYVTTQHGQAADLAMQMVRFDEVFLVLVVFAKTCGLLLANKSSFQGSGKAETPN